MGRNGAATNAIKLPNTRTCREAYHGRVGALAGRCNCCKENKTRRWVQMRCCLLCCPGDCRFAQSVPPPAHCNEACDERLPYDERPAVEAAFVQRLVQADHDHALQTSAGASASAGASKPFHRQYHDVAASDGEDSDGENSGHDEEEEDEEEDEEEEEEEEEDDAVEPGKGKVWWTVLCDQCQLHPRGFFYHREPNTDFCKQCFDTARSMHFLCVTRGCPYSGGIEVATVM